MAFFLIGKSTTDELRLLSTAVFASRQDAMATLSKLTAQPDFDRWDDEVFVVDLESGLPVLLVRPQAPAAQEAEEAEVVEPQEGGADAWLADLPRPSEAPAQEPSAVAAETESGAAVALEPAAAALTDSDAELRAAILRTTQQMSAEGIVAPESAGLAEAAEPAESSPEQAAEESAPAPEPHAAEETAPAETTAQPEPPAWPWAPSGQHAPADDELPDAAEVYSALAEPVADEQAEAPSDKEVSPYESLVAPVTGAREPMSAATPAPSAAGESDFILDLDAIEAAPAGEETPEATPESEAAAAEPEPEEAQEASAEEAEAPEEPATPPAEKVETPYSTPLTEYTCEDCVYVETCPNRDQRQPKDCGSFQWK